MLATLPSIDNSRCKCLAGNLRNVSIDVFNAGTLLAGPRMRFTSAS